MSMLELTSTNQGNGRATLGRTPIYRMVSSTDDMKDVRVLDATFIMGENIHDIIVMTATSPERTSTLGLLEQPITFLYGLSPKTEVFCGYITDISEEHSEAGTLTWIMTVVGPTKTMQSAIPRFWSQRTIPSAVELLANTAYLGYTGHAQDHVWTALAHTESSDWQMAVALAERLGWAVYNRYGVVMLYDPLQLFKNSGISAVLMSESFRLAKDGFEPERALLEFSPQEEAESSTPQQGIKIAYFSGESVQVATQPGEHSSYLFVNDYVIRNSEEAAIMVGAKDSDSDGWPQTATARIMGNAGLFPGMSVEIMTSSERTFPGKFNGRWLIRGVHHKMDQQTFQTNLTLARPDRDSEAFKQVYGGAYMPFWQTLSKSRPSLILSQGSDPYVQQSTGLIPSGVTSPGTMTGSSLLSSATVGTWRSTWTNPTARSAA